MKIKSTWNKVVLNSDDMCENCGKHLPKGKTALKYGTKDGKYCFAVVCSTNCKNELGTIAEDYD